MPARAFGPAARLLLPLCAGVVVATLGWQFQHRPPLSGEPQYRLTWQGKLAEITWNPAAAKPASLLIEDGPRSSVVALTAAEWGRGRMLYAAHTPQVAVRPQTVSGAPRLAVSGSPVPAPAATVPRALPLPASPLPSRPVQQLPVPPTVAAWYPPPNTQSHAQARKQRRSHGGLLVTPTFRKGR